MRAASDMQAFCLDEAFCGRPRWRPTGFAFDFRRMGALPGEPSGKNSRSRAAVLGDVRTGHVRRTPWAI